MFFRIGLPGMEVVLLLSEKQSIIYSGMADKDGRWQIEHLQSGIKLAEGNHSILVFNLIKVRHAHEVSDEQFLKLTTWVDKLIKT